MKDVLVKLIGKRITLVVKKNDSEVLFIDCSVRSVYESAVEVNDAKLGGFQIVPFTSIVRIEVKQ